jgi:5-hydroxyisourate hydrolase
MSTVTTHVLDTTLGRPAAGIAVRLERRDAATILIASGCTDADGRVCELGPDDLPDGVYRLLFETGAYFAATNQVCFFPEVSVTFALSNPTRHHHVPVLLSSFAYSTYRGS